MIKRYHRNITDAEIRELVSRNPSFWTQTARYLTKMNGVIVLLLVVYFIIRIFYSFPLKTEGIIILSIIAVAALAAIYLFNVDPIRAFEAARNTVKEVEIIHCKSNRAFRREAPESLGMLYYLDVGEGKTLFLQGQYLNILEKNNLFPNTEFELIRTKNTHEFMDIQLKGEVFTPEKSLEAYSKEEMGKLNLPQDGELLEISLEDLV